MSDIRYPKGPLFVSPFSGQGGTRGNVSNESSSTPLHSRSFDSDKWQTLSQPHF